MTGYVELSAFSNFTFLEGAAHAEELVETARALGHPAIAVADRNSFAGIARAHDACKRNADGRPAFPLVVGCRLQFRDGRELLAYPTDRTGYGNLCELLTLGRRRAPKGECRLDYPDLAAHRASLIVVAIPPETPALASNAVVMPGLGPGIHEFLGGQTRGCPAFAGHDDSICSGLCASNSGGIATTIRLSRCAARSA